MPHARRDGSSVRCPFGHAFAAAAAEASGAAVGSQSDDGAPVPREACLAAVAALWEKDRGYGVWWSDDPAGGAPLPVAIDAWYPTDLSVLLPAHELRPAWDEIKAWLETNPTPNPTPNPDPNPDPNPNPNPNPKARLAGQRYVD